jgi:hypothetical protein
MSLWQYLPRIKYNTPSDGADDFCSKLYKGAEVWFKVIGWLIVIGTLHY